MKVIVLVPNVVRNYIASFPETTQNAYKYFNYDNRVVNERAERRFDAKTPYKGPEDLSNQDYDTIVAYAKSLMNPILAKYSHQVACEDALHMSIKSYNRGIYDGKVNASKFQVLLDVLKQPQRMATKKEKEPKKAPAKTIRVKVDPGKVPQYTKVLKHRIDTRKSGPGTRLVKQKGQFTVI